MVTRPLSVPVALSPVSLLLVQLEVFTFIVVGPFELGFYFALLGSAAVVGVCADPFVLIALFIRVLMLFLPGLAEVLAFALEFDSANLVALKVYFATSCDLPLQFAGGIVSLVAVVPVEGVVRV